MALSACARLALLAVVAAMSRAGAARDKFDADSVLTVSEEEEQDRADAANTRRGLQSEVPPRADAPPKPSDVEDHPISISQLETQSSARAESDDAAALGATTAIHLNVGDYVKAATEFRATRLVGTTSDNAFLVTKGAIGVVGWVDSSSDHQVWNIRVTVHWKTGACKGQSGTVEAVDVNNLTPISEVDALKAAERWRSVWERFLNSIRTPMPEVIPDRAVETDGGDEIDGGLPLQCGDYVQAKKDLVATRLVAVMSDATFSVPKGATGVVWSVEKLPSTAAWKRVGITEDSRFFIEWQSGACKNEMGYIHAQDGDQLLKISEKDAHFAEETWRDFFVKESQLFCKAEQAQPDDDAYVWVDSRVSSPQ